MVNMQTLEECQAYINNKRDYHRRYYIEHKDRYKVPENHEKTPEQKAHAAELARIRYQKRKANPEAYKEYLSKHREAVRECRMRKALKSQS